jgi:hypothetical protein
MAKVAPPIQKKVMSKGAPPAAELVTNNLDKAEGGEVKTLTFKVSPDFHREFKSYATLNDLSMIELLYKAFEHYRESRG